MAHIPDIDISTRRIETMPSRDFAPSVWGEATRDIASAGHALAALAHRAAIAEEADDKREAAYNIALADNFFRNAALGHEATDPQTGEKKFIPGRLSLTRRQMEQEGTDSVKITRGIIDDMRQQDWYRMMKPSVRKHFDRKFILHRDAWMRSAGENDIKAKIADHAEKAKEYMALNAQGVASVYGADTPTFENAATHAAFKNMMFLEESAIENEDEFDSVRVTAANLKDAFSKIRWKDTVTDEYKNRVYNRMLKGVHEFEINRISALTAAAAKGENLGKLTPELCLETAKGIVDGLHGKTLDDVNPVTGQPTQLMTDEQSAAIKGEIGKAWKLLRSKNYQEAHDRAMETERQMFLKELPKDTDGVIVRYGEEAEVYAKLAEDKNLTAAQRRSYANAAQSLRQAAAKVKHEVATQAQQNRFEFELSNFEAGMDANGAELTYDDMQKRARDLLHDGKITPKQFHRLMAVQKKELNEEQKRFRDLVYADFPKLMPNITQRDGRFEFTPSKKVPSADKSTGYEVDVERGFWNDTEEVYTYGQFVRAMNAIFNLSKAQGLSAEEMKAMFDERTLPVRDGCEHKSINQCLAEIEENADSAASARANPGAVPPFVMKGRQNAGMKMKPWESPLSIGSQYLRDIFNK